jgi:hypothetical protein
MIYDRGGDSDEGMRDVDRDRDGDGDGDCCIFYDFNMLK